MIRRVFKYIKRKINIVVVNNESKSSISLKAKVDINTLFEGRNEISKNVSISKSNIGFATYIGENSKFHRTRIGRFCSIAANVKLVSGNHPTQDFVSTHPLFFSEKEFSGLKIASKKNHFQEFSFTDDTRSFLCEIGNDVWIGENVIILNGVSIGNGAIIATGTVVTKNVEAYSVVGGVPAKLIKYRFTDSEIEYLDQLKWWEKDLPWIQRHANFFSDVKDLREYEGNKID